MADSVMDEHHNDLQPRKKNKLPPRRTARCKSAIFAVFSVTARGQDCPDFVDAAPSANE